MTVTLIQKFRVWKQVHAACIEKQEFRLVKLLAFVGRVWN